MSKADDQGDVELLLERCAKDGSFSRRFDLASAEVQGCGAFGGVISVPCHMLHGQVLAVKVFWRITDQIRARLAREVLGAQQVFRLCPEHVVNVFGALQGDGSLYWIEMEFVDGVNLGEWLRELPADAPPAFAPGAEERTRWVLDVAEGICAAVAAAEAAGVVHRDIKPENVLLPRDEAGALAPVAKLGDFGLAKSEAATASGTTGWPGSALNRPPEVWRDQPWTTRGDVYGLGLLLYRLFTNNRFPLRLSETASNEEAYHAHVKEKPARLLDENEHAPRTLDKLLGPEGALCKDPQDRPSAAALLEGVRAVRAAMHASLAVAAKPAPVLPARWGAVVAGVLVLGGLAGLALVQGPDSVAPPSPEAASAAAADEGSASDPPSSVAAAPVPVTTVPTSTPAAPVAPAGASPVPQTRPRPQEPSPSSPSSPPPMRPPAARAEGRPAMLRIEAEQASLVLINSSRASYRDIEVVIIDPDGRRYRTAVPGELRPGELLTLPWDLFEPEPRRSRLRGAKVEVIATSAEGRLRALFPLPVK